MGNSCKIGGLNAMMIIMSQCDTIKGKKEIHRTSQDDESQVKKIYLDNAHRL
jgi:hypothetical protein